MKFTYAGQAFVAEAENPAIGKSCEGCAFNRWDPDCMVVSKAHGCSANRVIFKRVESASLEPAASEKQMILPTDPQARKGMPITTGVLDYFPLALAEVAVVSKAGNDQHNAGQPLHWAKDKSTDHADCIARHLIDRGARDSDGMRHAAKLCWRALALLETQLEAEAALRARGLS